MWDIDIPSASHEAVKLQPPKGASPNILDLSPDGKWIVWNVKGQAPQVTTGDDEQDVFQNTETGETFRTASGFRPFASYSWSPDSQYCASTRGKDFVAKDVRLLVINIGARQEWRSDPVPKAERVCALFSPTSMITAVENLGPTSTMPDTLYNVYTTASGSMTKLQLHLPKDEYFQALESSPSGKQLLWSTFKPYRRPTGILARLRTFFGLNRDDSATTFGWERLLVSRPDGTGMRELGQVTVHTTDDIREPHYMPDGRKISFIRNDALYVVSAD